jgi:hypothetical protein
VQSAPVKIGRNDPCSCSSGAKYKRCCLPKDEATRLAATASQVPEGARLVERDGEQYLVSPGMADENIDAAAEHFERKDGRDGPGPAGQMRQFIEPLRAQLRDDSPDGTRRVFALGALFWTIALLDEDDRDAAIDDAAKVFRGPGAAEFRELAADMIERHEVMFPEMHQRKAAT